ncbi:unnamed protein product [Blepharisma stoltei]|uniref:Uncharacterized protein n=1 Tax=Blepharisma stoltei TaxID=1481888 RepID=A0AAU9K142_9CILI|nr:unnamed protein product [Blepharisma stoltei]
MGGAALCCDSEVNCPCICGTCFRDTIIENCRQTKFNQKKAELTQEYIFPKERYKQATLDKWLQKPKDVKPSPEKIISNPIQD